MKTKNGLLVKLVGLYIVPLPRHADSPYTPCYCCESSITCWGWSPGIWPLSVWQSLPWLVLVITAG